MTPIYAIFESHFWFAIIIYGQLNVIFCYVKNVHLNQGAAALLWTDSGPDLIQKTVEKPYFIRVWRLRGTFFYCSVFLRRKLSFLEKEDIFNIKKCPPFLLLKRTKCT